MWSVSSRLGWKTASFEEMAAKRDGILCCVEQGRFPQCIQPHRRCFGIASARLVENQLGDEQLIDLPAVPPFSRDLLLRGENEVTTRPRRQIADDGGLYVGAWFHGNDDSLARRSVHWLSG